MNLRYSIPGKVWWITNFLDYPTYKIIHNAIFKERNKINFKSSQGTWDDILIESIIPPRVSGISNYPPFEKLKILARLNPYFQFEKEVEEMSTNIHYMQKGAGINWHNDHCWKYGVTYYINNRWQENWGGELMFTNENGHGFIPVVGNSLLILKAPLHHKVNPVITSTMPRVSVQMFIR